ncbi:MAG TPA: ABC transporter ATP-binding protein [Caulobacterales bacterium]|nr:ABC transporter ATP-binding protein [Caulobacterales bacterium]
MKAGALLSRLWREYLARYKLELLALLPSLALVALAGVSYAFILKYATDGIAAGDWNVIVLGPVAAFVATAFRAAAMWLQAVQSQGLSLKVLRDLQRAMFSKLMVADFARFVREAPGNLVSRFTNDINVVSEALVRGGQATVRDTLTLAGAVASMVYFDWALTLFILAVFALSAWPMNAIAKRARKQTEAAQAQLGALTALLSESLGSARFVKTYGLEQHEIERADAAFEHRRKLAMKLAYNRAHTVPLLEIIGGVALAGVLFVAGYRIVRHEMTLGDLTGIMGAFAVATPAARALGQFNTLLNEALAALTRIFGLVDEPVAIVDRAGAKAITVSEGRIEFDSVYFSYGEAPALEHVSFTVKPGETVALVGPSGAGKSTIFNLLPRLYDVTDGAVRIDGVDVRDATLASLRNSMALVAQEAALLNDTIRANIALGRPGASEVDIVEAARAAAAHDFIISLPKGYDTHVGDRGANLSGGERQRVALARAFLRNAPILLLDEATSALDAESEAKVQDALKRLAKGRTTLVIAHRLSTVRDADRILAFDAGRIVEMGGHEDLIAKGGLYARLSKLQFQGGDPKS